MNTAMGIINILGAAVGVFGPIATDLAFKIKHTLELNPDISVNIKNLEGEAIAADDATMNLINEYFASKGWAPPYNVAGPTAVEGDLPAVG